MKRISILLVILAVMPLSAWERGYQLDPHVSRFYDILELPSGNMLWLAEAQKATLLETNMGGDSLVLTRFPEIDSTFWAYSMEYGADSSIWIAGYHYNGTDRKASIMILDSDCNILDYIIYDIYGYDFRPKLIFDSEKNCVVVGNHRVSGEYIGWVFKTNPAGSLIWAKTLDTGGRVWFTDILIASDNSYYLVGGFQDAVEWIGRTIIIHVDESGDSLNGVVLPFDSSFTRSAELVGDSAIYLFGQSAPPGAWYYNSWIAMLDLDLNLIWQKHYDFFSPSYIFDSEPISDNRIILGYNVFDDIGLLLFDSMNGDTIYTQRYSSPGTTEVGNKLRVMSNGDYAVAGVHSAGLTRCLGFRVDSLGSHVPASIDETSELPSYLAIKTYPNPFNSAVTITAPSGAEIEIFDVNGRRVALVPFGSAQGAIFRSLSEVETTADGQFIWHPAPSLPSGVYLVNARFLSEDRHRGKKEVKKRVVYLK